MALAALFVVVLAVGALVMWGLWQNALRIGSVEIVQGDQSLATYATAAMRGAYAGIIPRDSTLFVPESAIRARILAEHPEIAAVSIYHTGIGAIAIRADGRTAVGRWCGSAPAPDPATAGPCYLFDPGGFVYQVLPQIALATSTATSSAPAGSAGTLNDFVLYAALAAGAQEPLRATIASADALPAAFDFARRLASFGSAATSVYVHDGEVDDALASGSRVLYILGHESDAFTALTSARADFNLADGSVEYVDARFPGKLYVKQKASK